MRLFVAVELDEVARKAAETAARELRERVGRALHARWVTPDSMHLTVRFIGHVDDARVQPVLDALRPPVVMPPFDVRLGDCGGFPSHGGPRVIWIGLREGAPALTLMHEEFNRRLGPLGFEPDSRPFNAHLTLARIKDAPRGSAAAVREALRTVRVPPIQWVVSDGVVFESRLSSKGSTYIPHLRVPLRP